MRDRDYSDYSVAELREALSTVDGVKHPENLAALEAELEKRIDSGEAAREGEALKKQEHDREQSHRRVARGARPWIGLYLMGAPLILFNTGTQMPTGFGWLAWAVWGLVILYVGASAVAGFGLWKRKNWGRRLAIGVFALQVIHFQSGILHFSLISALSVFFYVAAPGSIDFGVSAFVNFGAFRFQLGELALTFTVGFNLFALFMIWLLLKAREPLDGEEAGIDTYADQPAERPDLRP